MFGPFSELPVHHYQSLAMLQKVIHPSLLETTIKN
jgi:hypothetical protein